jgi:hypothetical protein
MFKYFEVFGYTEIPQFWNHGFPKKKSYFYSTKERGLDLISQEPWFY